MAVKAQSRYEVSIRIVCRALAISETCYRDQPKLSNENDEIAGWLWRLTQTYKRWRYGLCFIIFAEYQSLWLESQARLSDLPRIRDLRDKRQLPHYSKLAF